MGEIAEAAKPVADVRDQREPVPADGLVVGHDEHLLEEPLHDGCELGRGVERRAPAGRDGLCKGPFGRIGQQRLVDRPTGGLAGDAGAPAVASRTASRRGPAKAWRSRATSTPSPGLAAMPCATRTAAARASPATPPVGRSTRRSSPTPAEQLSEAVSSGGGATLDSAADLAPVVERFFDEVLVMSDDEAVRRNRLMVANVRDRLRRLGDFAQLPG